MPTKHSDFWGQEVPYFCLRVPTGGGKTFIAAKSVMSVNLGPNSKLKDALSFFMGKNTEDRKRYTIDNLRIETNDVEVAV